MKRTTLFLTTLVLAALLLAACGGQETSTSAPGTNEPSVTMETTSTEMATTAAGTGTAGPADLTITPNVPVTGEDNTNQLTNLMDYDVWNQNGDQIGEVDDMVLDFDNSSIAYVVVGTGGFLDIGEKEVLVPWNMFKVQMGGNSAAGDQNAFVYTGDQGLYDNYPDTDLSTLLPGNGQPATNWDADIQNYWQNGGNGAVIGQATNTPGSNADMTATPDTVTTDGTQASPGTGAQQAQGVMLASDLLGSTIQTFDSGTGADNGQNQGMGTETPVAGAATATNDNNGAAAVTAVATDSVSGLGIDNTLGTMDLTIDDVIVDPTTGEIQYLVVTGAFTGGQRTVPVPLRYLNWDAATQNFSLGVDTIGLVNAPAYENGQPSSETTSWYEDLGNYWDNMQNAPDVTPVP